MANGEKVETSAVPTDPWQARVGAFAEAVGKNIDDVNGALKDVVGDPGEKALEVLDNVEAVPDSDLIAAFKSLNIPSGVLKQHLKKLRGVPVVAEGTTSTAGAGSTLSILPQVPDDDSFLKALQVGGDLKVDEIEVLSAVKAGLADRVHLFDVGEKISTRMEEFATEQDLPVGKDFFRVRNLLNSKKYGDVLSVLDATGNFMSEKRKNDFLGRIQMKLWPSLAGFHGQLKAFYDGWVSTGSNPQMMMRILTGTMPRGMMIDTVDPGPIRSAADTVIEDINSVFAGLGIPVIRALAYDATRIMGILDEATLPAQLGLTTKDQMLKSLGVNVGSEVVRYEQSLTRYTLAIMRLHKTTAEDEMLYLTAMMQLGNSIPWDTLVGGRAGIGGNGKMKVRVEERG